MMEARSVVGGPVPAKRSTRKPKEKQMAGRIVAGRELADLEGLARIELAT